MKSFAIAVAVTSAVGLTSAAHAHIDLAYPPMRYQYDSNAQKDGPCGGGTPTGAITSFAPGQVVTVEWDETVNHPGHFRISLDINGGDAFVDPSGYDDFYVAESVLLDDIEDNNVDASFSAEITLPDQECERCTLQLIQVMTDKPPWGPGGGNDIYYWCADISIQSGAVNTDTGTETGAGTETGEGAGSGTGESSSGTGESSSDAGGCSVDPVGKNEDSPAKKWVAALGLGLLFTVARRRRR